MFSVTVLLSLVLASFLWQAPGALKADTFACLFRGCPFCAGFSKEKPPMFWVSPMLMSAKRARSYRSYLWACLPRREPSQWAVSLSTAQSTGTSTSATVKMCESWQNQLVKPSASPALTGLSGQWRWLCRLVGVARNQWICSFFFLILFLCSMLLYMCKGHPHRHMVVCSFLLVSPIFLLLRSRVSGSPWGGGCLRILCTCLTRLVDIHGILFLCPNQNGRTNITSKANDMICYH